MGEVENSSVDLLPSSPTPLNQNFSTDLDCDSDGCDEVLSPCPPSFGPSVPLDFYDLCSSISIFSCDVHEDQVLDGVGFEK